MKPFLLVNIGSGVSILKVGYSIQVPPIFGVSLG